MGIGFPNLEIGPQRVQQVDFRNCTFMLVRFPSMVTSATLSWDDLRVLLALHRQRSFLAAGRALGVSTSTASRRIEALESALGRSLVQRSSAGTAIDPQALELVTLAEQLELGLQAARRDEGDAQLSGTVRISMGEGFVRPLTHVLCDLRRKHQGLLLEIASETRLVDLARREADIGIRNARSSSPALVERPAGRLQFALYAAQSYVERRLRGGRLRDADFVRHDFIGFEGPLSRSPRAEWLVARGAAHFVVRSNSDLAQQAATEQGQGICLLAQAQARQIPSLVQLDTDELPPSAPVFLAYHRELRNTPRVRLVLDALEAALRQGLV